MHLADASALISPPFNALNP
jgi:hypothetical protein